ncbi:hypothetical protein PRZ48_000480 [Zasmidium cellare]|uniref:Exonuclease domain-containing protein n=1 Tax=Zasmidium cellare TaxID=395010 RepID=A0ABR0EYW9_ZASCE|nr:hypothetical protein PRZ48_000480 [Zasmidium cellare]
MGGRKRSRGQYEGDNLMGVGDTLAALREPDNDAKDVPSDSDGGEWQTVERSSKKRKKLPKKESDSYPSISHSPNSRLQSFVKLGDLQNLILYMLADGTGPQWCSIKNHANVRKVVALMVPGLEAGMFNGKISFQDEQPAKTDADPPAEQDDQENGWTKVSNGKTRSPDDYYPVKLQQEEMPAPLQPLADFFEHLWPIKTPGDDKFAKMHSPLSGMLTAPIIRPKEDKKTKGPKPPSEKNWKNKRTPVTELLATTEELVEEGYTMHPAHFAGQPSQESEAARRISSKTSSADGWVDTPDIPDLASGAVPELDIEKGAVTAGRKILSMDCEMCITSPAGQSPQVFSLTRISLIDWDGKVVLDEYVKPADPITDYLTPYSGITAASMEGVTTTLEDIQKKLLSIITPQTILIGHSLDSDLNALKLTHPFIIDTALLYPHPRGPPLKSSLKWLSQKYLSREIQKGHGSTGHDSVEDARACLDLVKQKTEKGKAWGTPDASAESIFKRLSRSIRPKRDKVNPSGDDEPRVGAVIDWGDPTRGYGAHAQVTFGCETDAEVVAGIKRALVGDEDGEKVPKGGCDFIWARMRELEVHRGWWNRSKLVDSEALRSSAAGNAEEKTLEEMVRQTVQYIKEVYDALPPCSALVVYSGSADPRELTEMQAQQQKFKAEYRVKKWDELSVRWTDVEEQKLRKACEMARRGIGFITVK